MLYHDSHDELYREPIGGVKAGGSLRLRFKCDEGEVFLRTWDGTESRMPMHEISDGMYEAVTTVPKTPMLFWYDFVIRNSCGERLYGTSHDQLGGEGALCVGAPRSYQVTVYDPEYKTPEFLREGVIYQIFPDRFMRGKSGFAEREKRIAEAHPEASFHDEWDELPTLDPDPMNGDNRALDFFGGTLEGIVQKLDYLKALGVSVIYLNPVFRSRTNHRYDTGSYEEIDPILGDTDDFTALTSAARERGIRIMMDGVFSHTGADSMYFNRFGRYDTVGAYQGQSSPFWSWYRFFEYPDKYDCWWGFYTLPAVDKSNADYRRYLLNPQSGALPAWVKRGACGWRLDVADELPMDLIAQMRSSVKGADSGAALLGEVWEDASNKVAYGEMRCYCLGDTLDSVMNYPLRRAVIDFFTGVCDAYSLRRVILHQREVYPAPFHYSLMNLLGSHDRVRILNALCGYDREGAIQMEREKAREIRLSADELAQAKRKYIEAVRLLCALPGAPTIYYGDEIGMTGMADPWNRAPMRWNNMDAELMEQIAELLNSKRSSVALKTGFMRVEAESADTLKIARYFIDGKDAFGNTADGEDVTVTVSRR